MPLEGLRARAKNHLTPISWLARDILRTSPRMFVGLFLLSGVAVVTRALTFLALLAYLHVNAEGDTQSFSLMGATVPVPLGRDDAGAWLLLVLGLGVTSAAAEYGQARLKLRIGRHYALSSARRVFDALIAGARDGKEGPSSLDPLTLQRLLGGEAGTTIRMAMPLGSMVLPLVQLTVFGGLLIFLSPLLTAFLAVLAVVYLVPYVLVTRTVVRAAYERETLSRQVSRSSRDVARLISQPQYTAELGPTLRDQYFSSSGIDRLLDLQQAVILNRDRVLAINNLFLALVLVALVGLSSGAAGPVGQIDWTELLAYAVVLRYAFVSLREVTVGFATFNRFSPLIGRTVNFHRQMETTRVPASGVDVPLRVSGEALPGSAVSRTCCPGEVAHVIDPFHQPTSLDLGRWWKKLTANREGVPRPVLVPDPRALPPYSPLALAAAHPDPDEGQVEAVRRLMQELGQLDDFDRAQAQGALTAAEASFELLVCIAFAPVVLGRVPVIVCPSKLMRQIDDETRRSVLRAASCSVVFLTSPAPTERILPDVDLVVVNDDTGIIGLGSAEWWTEAARPETRTAPPPATWPGEADLDDDDLNDV